MNILITGVGGLVGSEAALYFGKQGHKIIGIDDDTRSHLFGPGASIAPRIEQLKEALGLNFRWYSWSICDDEINDVFATFRPEVVIHTAAQPSHDWAAKNPMFDFHTNANGTLNVLEAARMYVPNSPFIFTSTNKVYGNTPNSLPLYEAETRLELRSHPFTDGITEEMSIDHSLHSIFGVSKTAADLMVQEYGRYFGMPTVAFRCGCITGPAHRGVELHGFLSYLMKCTASGKPYTVYGYNGKQVRDNIHAFDLVRAFDAFIKEPQAGAVYNLGGGFENSCSVLEAIRQCEFITGKKLNWTYDDNARVGDHKWWITSNTSFQWDYPRWGITKGLDQILREIYEETSNG